MLNIGELDDILTLRSLTPKEKGAVVALMKKAAEEAVEEYKSAQLHMHGDSAVRGSCNYVECIHGNCVIGCGTCNPPSA